MHGIFVPLFKNFDLNWISYLTLAVSFSIIFADLLHIGCKRLFLSKKTIC